MIKEKALEIINHYGVSAQLKYFQSEVFELNEAIINAENYIPLVNDSLNKINCNVSNYVEHIAEEIADVMLMLKQFQEYYKISDDRLGEIMHYKADRQLKRIEEENGK